jgi:hypothetical protein
VRDVITADNAQRTQQHTTYEKRQNRRRDVNNKSNTENTYKQLLAANLINKPSKAIRAAVPKQKILSSASSRLSSPSVLTTRKMSRLYANTALLRRAIMVSASSSRAGANNASVLPSHNPAIIVGHPSLWPPTEITSTTPTSTLHQRVQYRYFDARKKQRKKRKSASKNPFKILGVPEGATLFKDVKKKFLQIAMKNHPDTVGDDVTDEDRDKMREVFIKARMAFESLAEDPMDGTAILKEELDDAMENFDSWFKNETGHDSPFQFDMDPETMKEVANMTETMGGGLDRDGGMWALARMVTAAVKSGSDAATMLRLESGDVKERDRSINGGLRRRRKR